LTNAAFDTAVNGGLEQQAVTEIKEAAPPKVGMAACNAYIRNPPKQYVPRCIIFLLSITYLVKITLQNEKK
jgi:hypothetical protein